MGSISGNSFGFLGIAGDQCDSQVVETLLEMRTQRMGLIQTEDQLRFSVEALILALKRLQGEEVRSRLQTSYFFWTISEESDPLTS